MRTRIWTVLLSLTLSSACSTVRTTSTIDRPSKSIALTGATVIIGDGTPPVPVANIIIEDGRIACVGSEQLCPVPAHARQHDMAGQFIMPGLVDAHVHYSQTGWIDGRPDVIYLSDNYPYSAVYERLRSSTEVFLRSHLCAGVTATLDVGGFFWTVDLEDATQTSATAPFVETTGPLLTPSVSPVYEAEVDAPMMLLVDSPESGRLRVREVAERGASAIKLALQRPPGDRQRELVEVMEAVGDEAQAHDLPLIVHATHPVWARAAVRAGAHLLAHNIEGATLDQDLIDLIRAEGTIITPTTLAAGNWDRAMRSAINLTEPTVEDPNGCVDPMTRDMLANVPDIVKPPGAPPAFSEEAMAAFEASDAKKLAMAQSNLKALHEAGVVLAIGTDAGNPLTPHGASIYAELEVTQAAGIPALEVITMATRNGARAMGRGDQFGTLEAGKAANLIVLGADPSADIANVRQLNWVMRHGKLHRQRDLRLAQPGSGQEETAPN